METPCETTRGKKRTDPAENKKITKASNLTIGQLIFVLDHCKDTFDPAYIYDHRLSGILNDRTGMLITPDGKEKKCNVHHNKPIT